MDKNANNDIQNLLNNSLQKLSGKSDFKEKFNPNFYFDDGKKELEGLKEIDKKVLQSALEKTKDKEWYSKVRDETGNFKDDFKDVGDKINAFVAYCDVNAKGSAGKPCIAKAGIRQNAWIKNVLQYLVNLKNNKENHFEGVAYGVMRAIQYFDNPQDVFPILSKRHQESIAKYFELEINNDESFDKNLKGKLDSMLLSSINVAANGNQNLTSIYTSILYDIKSQWEDYDITFYEENQNVILTGAPGTGKTYLAKKVAAKIIGCREDELENVEQFGFVQFHPSYDYTDFVEGLRPIKSNGSNGVEFELMDGVFKQFCLKALKNPKHNYVFVIDEINRGEMSKIFGELFFSIDPGYRGKQGAVQTQYANMVKWGNQFDWNLDNGKKGQFFVSENVYIIGTMNDIDRSVESMDFAFRRRFAFKEITATDTQEDILYYSDLNLSSDDLGKLTRTMNAINDCLTSLNFSDSYHIGGAYFKKISKYSSKSKTKWECLWKYHLKGTLYEYFRGEPDADKKMTILKTAYDDALNS